VCLEQIPENYYFDPHDKIYKECFEFACTSWDCPEEVQKLIFVLNMAMGDYYTNDYYKRHIERIKSQ